VSLPYIINTDASGQAIGAVLMQTNDEGETFIVSTASRVLNPIERRYSVAKQELLAIVFALQKFRIYIFGHKVNLYTDNKALSFIHSCALTSSRISRWILHLQEYDLRVRHISGAKNFLADTITRNPAGISQKEFNRLSQPQGIVVSAVNLGADSSVSQKLRELNIMQARDPKLARTIKAVEQGDIPKGKYLVRSDTLYAKNEHFLYWRPVLLAELEDQIINYVHCALGQPGTEKCMYQISHTFHVNNLGRKVRRLISRCDICQRVKHPDRSYETKSSCQELCGVDLYGPLPAGRPVHSGMLGRVYEVCEIVCFKIGFLTLQQGCCLLGNASAPEKKEGHSVLVGVSVLKWSL
jgi:hypothetical protein